jgi:hypothetical protein
MSVDYLRVFADFAWNIYILTQWLI